MSPYGHVTGLERAAQKVTMMVARVALGAGDRVGRMSVNGAGPSVCTEQEPSSLMIVPTVLERLSRVDGATTMRRSERGASPDG